MKFKAWEIFSGINCVDNISSVESTVMIVSSSLLIVHSGFKLVPRRRGSKGKRTWSENGGHV